MCALLVCVCPCESVLVVTLGRVRLCFSLSGPQAYMYLTRIFFFGTSARVLAGTSNRMKRPNETQQYLTYKQLGSSNPSLSCSHNTAIGVVVSSLLIQQTLAMLLVTPTLRQSDQPSADCTVEDRTANQHALHHAKDELHGTRTQCNP